MKIICNVGKMIDQSPYKREFIRQQFGKSRNTISSWCTGKTYMSIPEALLLCQLLNCKFEDLYKIEDKKTPTD